MRYVVAPFVVAAFLLTAWVVPSHAQVDSREGIALQNQIYQLRQELQAAEGQMQRGGSGNRPPAYAPTQLQGDSAGSGSLVPQLLTRVDALEDQVRQLRGRVDELQNQLQQQNADLGKRIDDLAFQINPQGAQQGAQPGAQQGAPQTPQLGSNPPSPDYPPQGPVPTRLGAPPDRAAAPPVPRTPEIALKDGRADLARHDYPKAEAAAHEVLANRTSPRAYDARLLLAQALYGQRQYAQAAIAFDDAYNSSRKGTHAQDALLGLANSLSVINEKKAACDSLTRLRTEFPKPRPDIAAGAAAAARKTGCR